MMFKFSDYSYGASAAVITSIAVIIGLSDTAGAKVNIIAALLIIAVADNISDSFGIHIYQESLSFSSKDVVRSTTINFITRFLATAVFIVLVLLFPIYIALVSSIIFGLAVITLISYIITQNKKYKTHNMMIKHLLLAVAVIIASFLLKQFIAHSL
jgi:vacuolar iron transporter family protein